VGAFARRVGQAGFGLVVGPLLEDVAVFQRVGPATDIVRKEMYELTDRGGRHLALRPEGTAAVVRAYLQHRPPLPFKAWYASPHFRYERAQAGRYRQHHSLGVEALGTADPALDVEVVELAWRFVTGDVGLAGVEVVVGSLGDGLCRPAYLAALARHLAARRHELCPDHAERAEASPLRVLDCRRPACREATADAPRLLDALCPACAEHFAAVRAGLDAAGVAHRVDPRLVRGLDYYTRTLFELPAAALPGAQSAVGGGGRYDDLAEALGGPATPGMGFGLGIERLLLAADAEGSNPVPAPAVAVWVVDVTGGDEASALARELRAAGIGCDRSFDHRSMRAQLRAADRAGARVAVLVGDRERAGGVATVRDLATGDQREVERPALVAELARALGPARPPAGEGRR